MTSGRSVVLRWRGVGAPREAWLPLRPIPDQNGGFTEAKQYVFEKPGTDWLLQIDDEPIDDDSGDGMHWRWEPRFFAGEVTAELLASDGSTSILFLLDVAPEPTKMGRQVFERMLEELWKADPALVIGTEPGTRQIGDLGSAENAWLEFARFRRYVPEFLRAVLPLRANPHRALTVRRIAASLHHVRRVDHRTATALARSPALAVLLRGSGHASTDSENGRLDVPFVEETLDSSANRAMFALVLALIRRGLSLYDRLQELVDRESDNETRTSLGVRWPARKQVLAELVIRLKALRHQLPFVHVQRPEITAAGLTAVAADPSYARAWGRGWRALRRGLESGPSVERLWVSPSWEIYERWCFLRLGQLLSAARPNWHWNRRPNCWVGLSGTCRAELRLQPTFRSSPEETGRMWSISKERVPDLVLTVESAAGIRFLVLDAKYRSSRSNVLDAMASAHIYQDSLRIGPNRPDASLLLVPSGGGASWLEAPTFQMMHQVGVHVLAPDRDNTMPEAITAVLVV